MRVASSTKSSSDPRTLTTPTINCGPDELTHAELKQRLRCDTWTEVVGPNVTVYRSNAWVLVHVRAQGVCTLTPVEVYGTAHMWSAATPDAAADLAAVMAVLLLGVHRLGSPIVLLAPRNGNVRWEGMYNKFELDDDGRVLVRLAPDDELFDPTDKHAWLEWWDDLEVQTFPDVATFARQMFAEPAATLRSGGPALREVIESLRPSWTQSFPELVAAAAALTA